MPSGEFDTEFGVDDSGIDFAGPSFLVGLVYLVVRSGGGAVVTQYHVLDEHYGLGCGLQQHPRSTEGEQKPLLCRRKEEKQPIRGGSYVDKAII